MAHICLSSANVLKLLYVGNKRWAREMSLDNFAPLDITGVPILSLVPFFGELFVKAGHVSR